MLNLDDARRIAAESRSDFRRYDSWREHEKAFVFAASDHEGYGGLLMPFYVMKADGSVRYDYSLAMMMGLLGKEIASGGLSGDSDCRQNERMDVIECVKYMTADSGQSVRRVSQLLDRSPNFLGTTFSKRSDIGSSNVARIANLLGWRLVLKKGDVEVEVAPRADGDNRPDDER